MKHFDPTEEKVGIYLVSRIAAGSQSKLSLESSLISGDQFSFFQDQYNYHGFMTPASSSVYQISFEYYLFS